MAHAPSHGCSADFESWSLPWSPEWSVPGGTGALDVSTMQFRLSEEALLRSSLAVIILHAQVSVKGMSQLTAEMLLISLTLLTLVTYLSRFLAGLLTSTSRLRSRTSFVRKG